MSSITARTDPHDTRMSFHSARRGPDRQRKLWVAEGAAYGLAILAHLGLWQVFQSLPPPPPPEEPLIIEAALVVPQPAAAAAPAAAPPPQAKPEPPKPQPKPKPKPVPKIEKPELKKPDKPKPIPKPRPEPQAEAEPAPVPAPPAPPAPVVEEAPPAPVASHAKAAPKAEADDGEDHGYHKGGISGFSRRYPRLAMERGWEGTVTLKVHILADGDIGEVIVIKSSGHEILDEQAADLIKEARATPARRGEVPVDSWVVVPYQFKLTKQQKARLAEPAADEPGPSEPQEQ